VKIAVTGANGFVGRELCRLLASHGHQVVAITRREPEVPLLAQETRLVHDFLNDELLSSSLDGCEILIHLAGRAHMLRDTAADPLADFRAVNVEVSEKLVLAAAAKGMRRFVFVSSIGVNGNTTNGRPFTEADTPAPHDLYAISKWEAEQRIVSIAGKLGIDYVVARPVLMFGPDAPGNFELLLKLAAKALPLPFGLLTKRRNLLSVWNFADFLRTCAEHPTPIRDTFVVSDAQTVTLPEIFKYLGEGMEVRQHLLPVPRALLAAVVGLLGKGAMLRKVDSELMVSPDKAIKLFNWTPPYSTRAALVKTGEEYKKRKM
jgi:nucleoside-diphosphate-sugar epimerase